MPSRTHVGSPRPGSAAVCCCRTSRRTATWVKPLHDPCYEPLWSELEELGLPVNVHGGTGLPDYGRHPHSMLLYLTEVQFYAQRPLVHMLLSGVFERHPELKFVITESGAAVAAAAAGAPGRHTGDDPGDRRHRRAAVPTRGGPCPARRPSTCNRTSGWASPCPVATTSMRASMCSARVVGCGDRTTPTTRAPTLHPRGPPSADARPWTPQRSTGSWPPTPQSSTTSTWMPWLRWRTGRTDGGGDARTAERAARGRQRRPAQGRSRASDLTPPTYGGVTPGHQMK